MRCLDPSNAELGRLAVRVAKMQRSANTEVVDFRRSEPVLQALRGGQSGPHLGNGLRVAATKDDLQAVIFQRDFAFRRVAQKIFRVHHCSFSRWSFRASRRSAQNCRNCWSQESRAANSPASKQKNRFWPSART